MATPTTRALELPGPAGVPVTVAVTSAGGWRPVIVLSGEARSLAPFVERLSRAGFAAVACEPRSPAELTTVLEALEQGALGVDATTYGVLECAADGSLAVSRVRSGGRGARRLDRLRMPEAMFDRLCVWLLRELG